MMVTQSMMQEHVAATMATEPPANRTRWWGLGVVAALTLIAGGCCEDGRREMDRLADKYNDQAFECCKAIAESDPEAAVECFGSVKDWRLQTGGLILEWYQACLAGNRALADEIIGVLKGLVVSQATGGCGGTVELSDGRRLTVGIPFSNADRISVSGSFSGPFGLLVPPPLSGSPAVRDASIPLQLNGGHFSLQAWGGHVEGSLAGTLSLEALGGNAFRVQAAALDWTVGAMTATMRLDDPQGLSALVIDGGGGTLSMRLGLSLPAGLGALAPPTVWLRLPARVTTDGIAIATGVLSAPELFPPALGMADWNGDTHVDLDDWIAFITTEPIGMPNGILDLRDVTLDGAFDAADIHRFVGCWRERFGQ